ncbi:hypothetical protein [Caldalkalibacillus mannanilyticus]|uniref:hypothetical protein n=1 Tax=Caldalkalibacillus mannanilyticus TaxID=1418 RepID=UPI00046908BC|nr:hypothetical protein [Caldalkalibacillus mannanilyticus]
MKPEDLIIKVTIISVITSLLFSLFVYTRPVELISFTFSEKATGFGMFFFITLFFLLLVEIVYRALRIKNKWYSLLYYVLIAVPLIYLFIPIAGQSIASLLFPLYATVLLWLYNLLKIER